ncbi:phage major capsid protein [Polynucleobacter sp. CS-Odin-A6]|uniref:phage major capsid protein n=1 Tax=Polynucleobacter sp. CS-Odin-A6 TaxID=2689106 RepID=UPI001C0B4F9C|nr:phage major capsid protein [Polynucleobacter sp. CS-Odin-A6]MBU3620922.1 phage major capsid protein [Polynucleobacter sp. CS-Odin-A6]
MTHDLLALVQKGNEDITNFVSDFGDRLNTLEADQTKSNRPNFTGGSNNNTEWRDAFDTLKGNDFNGRVALSRKAIVSDSGLSVPAMMNPIAMTATTGWSFIEQYLPTRIVDAPSVVVNKIGSTDTAGVQAAQGDAKKLLAISTSSSTVELLTYACYAKISTQALQDIPDLQSIVNNVLNLRLRKTIDDAIWTMANTAGNNTAYVSASTTVADNLVGAAAQLALYGLSGTFFLNPQDYATLALTKASTSGVWLGMPQMYGITIAQASSIPSGKFLLTTLDGVGVSLAERSQAMLILGLDGEDLTRNLRTVLLEKRVVPFTTDAGRVLIGDLVSV